jgi:hypothetical protein
VAPTELTVKSSTLAVLPPALENVHVPYLKNEKMVISLLRRQYGESDQKEPDKVILQERLF